MPLRTKPVCTKCESTETPLWHQTPEGILCSDCEKEWREEIKNPNLKKEKDLDADENNDCASNSSETKTENGNAKTLRRSTRSTRYKQRLNPFALPKATIAKGKGRRCIFKKTPTKAPTSVATPVTSDSIFYKVRILFQSIDCIFSYHKISKRHMMKMLLRNFITFSVYSFLF